MEMDVDDSDIVEEEWYYDSIKRYRIITANEANIGFTTM